LTSLVINNTSNLYAIIYVSAQFHINVVYKSTGGMPGMPQSLPPGGHLSTFWRTYHNALIFCCHQITAWKSYMQIYFVPFLQF